MHDSEVVAAIVAGDPDGLAEAYDRYAAPLYTYCRSLLREPADAADAVQDTFVIAASSHGPSPSHSPSPSRTPSPSASSTNAPPPPPPPGTLRVAPRTIVVSALSGASLTLTASGGPVSWSVTESSGLIGQLSVAPSSGRLLAGQSTTVSVNVSGGLVGLAVPRTGGGVCVGCQLTINPGGIVVSIVIEVDVTPSSPPPSSKPPSPEVITGRPAARLVN